MQGMPLNILTKGVKTKEVSLGENSLLKNAEAKGIAENNNGDFLELFSQLAGKNPSISIDQKNPEEVLNLKNNKIQNTENVLGLLQSTEGEDGSNLKLKQPSKLNTKNEDALALLSGQSKEEVQAPKDQSEKNKLVTGDDFLKNMQIAGDKKLDAKLSLLQGGIAPNQLQSAKGPAQNIKLYGHGQNVLNDNVVRSAKDLAFKDKKITGQPDELKKADLKISAELAQVKQDSPILIQNKAEIKNELQAQSNQKVLDLSKINTSNPTEIIKKISDYVEQNHVANKQSLDLTVKHDSLGEFKIQVSRSPGQSLNQIDMQISTGSKEGHEFFVKNEVSLIKNLNQSGIQLSDLRIVTHSSESSMLGQSDSRQSSSFQQSADGSSRQYSSFESSQFSSEADGGAQKRKALWQEYQDRYGA